MELKIFTPFFMNQQTIDEYNQLNMQTLSIMDIMSNELRNHLHQEKIQLYFKVNLND